MWNFLLCSPHLTFPCFAPQTMSPLVSGGEVLLPPEENAIYQLGDQFSQWLGTGLADNWSQVGLVGVVCPLNLYKIQNFIFMFCVTFPPCYMFFSSMTFQLSINVQFKSMVYAVSWSLSTLNFFLFPVLSVKIIVDILIPYV